MFPYLDSPHPWLARSSRPRAARTTSCRPRRDGGRRCARSRSRRGCTATGASRRRASRTPASSSAPPARPRTWCTRRCTRSPTAATARSRCGPRAPRRSRAPTSSTASRREPQPVKLFTIAPMYRYGRPGRGRYREHWQLSLEAIGSPGPEIDAEVIQFYAALLGRLGVTEWELHLNSIGDAACRPAYVERLNAWLDAHPELATEEVGHKRATSPLQVFDVKDERLRAALADAPKIGESLCDACQEHFDAVRAPARRLRRAVRRRSRARARARLLHAHRVRVRRARRRTSTPRSAAAAATTGSSRRSAVRRRRASASVPGSSG